MANSTDVVRIPLYHNNGGGLTGESVEIPLHILRNMVRPIRVLGMDMKIVKDEPEPVLPTLTYADKAKAKQRERFEEFTSAYKSQVLVIGPVHPDHPEHEHEDCCK